MEVECDNCGWRGYALELLCSEEDARSNKPTSEIDFNLCPECGSDEVYDIDEDEE